MCSKIRQIFNSHNRYTNSVPNLTNFKKWIYLTLFVWIVKNEMKYANLPTNLFIENRNKFSKTLKDKSLAIFKMHNGLIKSSDQCFSFKQNPDLFYIYGIDYQKTILLLQHYCPNPLYKEVLFLRQTNEHLKVCERNKYTKSKNPKAS